MKEKQVSFPSPRTAGMMTQHKKFSSENVARHFRHVSASSKKNAVDRIPSPRTAGMTTQHKNSKKFSSEIVTRHLKHVCASEILLALFVNQGSNSATGLLQILSRSTTKRNFCCLSNS
jgi:hypothetical protein